MANEWTITKERVLEAASKCSQAKETLKTLFPEVFVEEVRDFNLYALSPEDGGSGFIFGEQRAVAAGFDGRDFMQVRNYETEGLRGKAFFLSSAYTWELRRTETEVDLGMLLIPTRKQ